MKIENLISSALTGTKLSTSTMVCNKNIYRERKRYEDLKKTKKHSPSSGPCRHMLVHYSNAFNRAPKARQLALGGDAGRALFHPSGSAIQAFDLLNGSELALLRGGHFNSVNACAWNPALQELYSGGNDGNVVVWQPKCDDNGAEGEGEAGSDRDAWSE
jgi:hypothetical protein